ncbi:MAG: hypothetical protein NC338_05555 [Firmicutes bacterium]|nr:hypothetical protein [Bacillota bacterium]MCM1401414.1 hypothetical protein [Bacteroides sp.]MCM1477316.1 hypothetical protein [Bacteroides sp.]
MINRALIRIKVVQMLFSYFLNRNEFQIYDNPESASKDKQFAYSFYLDLLLMSMRLSGYNISQSSLRFQNKFLNGNRISKALKSDVHLKDIVFKRVAEAMRYDAVLESIYSEIIGSAAYRSYTHKKERDITSDTDLWNVIVNSIFAKSQELLVAARTDENFTNVGYESALSMLSETIKSCGDSSRLLIESRNALKASLAKAYELYNRLLLLPSALVELQDRRIDSARNKFLATADDLNPNMKFVDNRMVKILNNDVTLTDYREANHINWMDDYDFLQKILDAVLESELYAQYMESPTDTLEADCEFWRQVMKQIILPSDALAELLESKSVFWNDDVDIIGTFVCKTFRRVARSEYESPVLPQFKDEEDERFGGELFVDTIDNFETYRSYIDKFINARQWDPERLAFMDVIIMATATSELLNFPSIPIPVTLNEYIEIANCYSTPRSGQFINGILYSVINYLKEEGLLLKK